MRSAQFLRPFLLILMLPLASLAFACSSSSAKKVDADDWVDNLCDIAADFSDASDKAGAALDDADLTDTKAAKKAFAESLNDQKDAQKDFRSDFDKLGQPDIQDGDKVLKAFHEQFDANTKATDGIGKAVAKINNDNDFLSEFLDLADEFNPPEFREKLEDLADDSDDVQDLIDSIDADPDCSDTIFQDAGGSGADSGDTPTSTAVAAPKTQNEKWVAGICSAFGDWADNIGDANDKFQTEVDKSSNDGPAIKKSLVTFLKASQSETKDLQSRVSKLKAPDVKDGAKIHKVFVDTSGDLVTAFDDLVAKANKIDTSSASKTLADVTDLGNSVDDVFAEAGDGFAKLDSFNGGELEDLFDSRPECSGL